MSAMSPAAIMSRTLPSPSWIFLTCSHSTPAARSARAVPPVATSWKPRRAMSRAMGTMARLSRSHTLTNTVPPSGSA